LKRTSKDIRGYNERSNIPLELVREIFTQILDKWKKGEAGVALQPLEFGKMGGRKTPKQRALEKLKNNKPSEE
jgi:hypothetical protein